MAESPNDPQAHALLALCLAKGEQLAEATEEAQEAVRLAPDLAFTHYALATSCTTAGAWARPRAPCRRRSGSTPKTRTTTPCCPRSTSTSAAGPRPSAAAEAALALDPEHGPANNLRAIALVRLGRRDEAGATIEAALARDPEDAVTHANQGWARMHAGDFRGALEHFREALRLNPSLEWARAGLVEALKARYPLYGLLLRYFLWMSTLSRRAQWAVILGGLFGFRALRALAANNPALAPWITPLLVLYGLFVFFTWTAEPLFNLLLRLNRFGRYALSDEEISASNWVGGAVLAVLGAGLLYAFTRNPAMLGVVLAGALVVLLVSGVFRCPRGWPRTVMAVYTGAVAFLALASVPLTLANPDDPEGGLVPLALAVLLGVAGTWVATFLSSVRPKR